MLDVEVDDCALGAAIGAGTVKRTEQRCKVEDGRTRRALARSPASRPVVSCLLSVVAMRAGKLAVELVLDRELAAQSDGVIGAPGTRYGTRYRAKLGNDLGRAFLAGSYEG